MRGLLVIKIVVIGIVFISSLSLLPAQDALTDGSVFISQTWSTEEGEIPLNRESLVRVPEGLSGKLPVLILLHGSGMDPVEMLNTYSFLDQMIHVSCRGHESDWNISFDAHQAPDVEFIDKLILKLRTYSNVDADNISILGFSNGAGLLNRLLIELALDRFTTAVCLAQQLRHVQYHAGSFWYDPNGGWSYDTPIVPAKGRRILTIHGHADAILPYAGNPGHPELDLWMDAQSSAYRWAQAMGYTGEQLTFEQATQDLPVIKYNYLDGQVVHYLLSEGDHRLNVPDGDMQKSKEIIEDFLRNRVPDEQVSVSISNSVATISLASSSVSFEYILQHSDDLFVWQNVSTKTGTGSGITWQATPDGSAGFYRVQMNPL